MSKDDGISIVSNNNNYTNEKDEIESVGYDIKSNIDENKEIKMLQKKRVQIQQKLKLKSKSKDSKKESNKIQIQKEKEKENLKRKRKDNE